MLCHVNYDGVVSLYLKVVDVQFSISLTFSYFRLMCCEALVLFFLYINPY